MAPATLGVRRVVFSLAALKWRTSSSLWWPPPWGFASDCHSCQGPVGHHMGFLVELLEVVVHCFLVRRFSGKRLAYAGDDGVVGIIFLLEGVTVRISTCRD